MAIIKKFRIKSFKQKKPILKLENISLSFGNRQILENINIEINKGEIFGMLGPNGVGKSTIFNLITGLISPEKGSIFIGGEKVNEYPEIKSLCLSGGVALNCSNNGKLLKSGLIENIFVSQYTF